MRSPADFHHQHAICPHSQSQSTKSTRPLPSVISSNCNLISCSFRVRHSFAGSDQHGQAGGNQCPFWDRSSVSRREHVFLRAPASCREHLGMTIHRISQRIDGGALLCRGWPALNGNESEADLWAKGGIMAARMLIELLSHVQSIRTSCDAKEADLKCNELLAGVHQSEKGKLYLFRERTFVRQCWYEWFARTQFPARAERVEWFTPPMSQPSR